MKAVFAACNILNAADFNQNIVFILTGINTFFGFKPVKMKRSFAKHTA